MGTSLNAETLKAAVLGNIEALGAVEAEPHSNLREARSVLDSLLVTSEATACVLLQLRAGEITPEQAQRWASFVRRGYVAGRGRGSVQPIEIGFEASAEEPIAEVISRLDEIGDSVDGSIDTTEIDELLSSLRVLEDVIPAAPT